MKLKTHFVFGIGLLSVLAGDVIGQGLCDRGGGGFTLNKNEGCAPLDVNWVSTVPNPILIGYSVSYDGRSLNPATQNISSYRYASPGEFTILQQGATGSGAFFHCEKVKVIESRVVTLVATACGGGKINLTLTKDVILNAYDRVEINWDDGSDVQIWKQGDGLNLEHAYANVNSKPIIKVRGLYDAGACREGIVRNVPVTFEQANLANIQIASVVMRDDNSIRLVYNGLSGITTAIKYRQENAANYTTFGSRAVGGSQPVDIRTGVSKQNIYQLQLDSEDRCGGKLPSEAVSTMIIEATPSSGSIKVKWNKYSGTNFLGYDLYNGSNGELIESFSSIDNIEYTDTNVECGDYVSYYVVAKVKNATSQSAPSEGFVVAPDANQKIEKGMVSVVGDKVSILAEVPGKNYKLIIERALNGSQEQFRRIMELSNQNEYIDENVKTNEQSYCYRMRFEACDIQSPFTEKLCTILLEKNLSTLNWSGESPFVETLEGYNISQTGQSGSATDIERQQNVSYTPTLNAQSESVYTYQVKATSAGGDFESFSNPVVYRRSAEVFMPNAFSPNDDYYNDELLPIAEPLKQYSFTIFNRWGAVVFHTADQATGWNGKFVDKDAAVGSYIYKITFRDELDQQVEKSGTFMLLR
jgi:gliding motility-associated-like protein